MIMNAIQDRISSQEGDIGICFINLETGQRFFCGNCDVFPASGTVKLMTLVECFKAFEEHRLQPEEIYCLNEKDKMYTDGPCYGILHFLDDGLKLTMMDLCKLMVIVADNQACNILIDRLGMDAINRTFYSLGYPNMRINRKIFDEEKIARGVDNVVSVKEMATLFERLYRGQLVSPEASCRMIELMEKHQRTSILPYLFKETAKIAHQTGFDEDTIIDGGILYFDTPFVLTMAASKTDIRKAQTIMRDITQICYEETQGVSLQRHLQQI